MPSLRLKPEHHRNIFFSGLILMAIGLPFSKFLMSISQFVLLGNWLWEGDVKNKLKMFWHNKPALILSSLWALYVFGLMYSTDFNYAWNDIRIKLPLLILPMIFSSSAPLSEKEFAHIMKIFSAAVIAASFISIAALMGFTKKFIENPRDISIFISHIRFSLLICIAILYLFYSSINEISTQWRKWAALAGAFWLIIFLFILESITGLTALVVSVFFVFLIFSFTQNKIELKIFYSGIVLGIPLVFSAFLYNEIENYYNIKPVNFSQLDEFSKEGEKYIHDTARKSIENGNYVWLYFAPNELEREWNKYSEIKFSEKDKRGQPISTTLARFLTSKNLRKDAEGIAQLNSEEIKAIERGSANVMELEGGIRLRIYQIIWEFDHYFRGANPQGNSITQRIEFWKAAWNGIKKNLFLGVGTGDLQAEMNAQYSAMQTKLETKYWLKPHNQFFTIFLTFGIFGLAWFLFFLFSPMILQKMKGDFFYTTFFVISILSMFTEDTLDTQAGISFFAFFSCLFLFRKR